MPGRLPFFRNALGLLLLLGLLVPTARAGDLDRAAERAAEDLDRALRELSEIRQQIAEERIPLAREVRELEQRVGEQRRLRERLRETKAEQRESLERTRREREQRQETLHYLRNLLDDYLEAFETRIHIAELPHYREDLRVARETPGDAESATGFDRRLDLLDRAVRRLDDNLGGHRFSGEALLEDGRLQSGVFALIGPVAVFDDEATGRSGLAVQRPGSLRPRLQPVAERDAAGIRELVRDGSGILPVDTTLGLATRRAEARGNLWSHLRQGGPVMIPILLLALVALGVAIYKWFEIRRMPPLPPEALQRVLEPLNRGNPEEARRRASQQPGPAGEMLAEGVAHVHEGRDLAEEVMYEKMLRAQPRLERLMPLIALTAATAPLLGLLGTVTGMIQTFQLITLFGTGDAQALSGGISEALITTQFGLIVAVPALILHALLSRKSKAVLANMQQTSIGFLNGLAAGRTTTDA